jgi:TolB-like protein
MRKISFVCLLGLLAAPAMAGDKKTIAIMPFKSALATQTNATIIAQTLGTMLAQKGVFEVLDREHMAKVMDEKQLEMAMASDDQIIELGMMVHANYLVIGEVGALGSKMNLNVRFLSTDSGKVEIVKRLSWSDPDALEELLMGLASELSGGSGAMVAFDPKFGGQIWKGIEANICRARQQHSGRVLKNLAGNITINLGSDHMLSEGSVLSVMSGGEELGEIELSEVRPRSATGTFSAIAISGMAKPGAIVKARPIRLAVAEFSLRGATGFDSKDLTKQVLGHLKGARKGCTLGKRSMVRGFAKMSDGRKKRMASKVDAVVVGTVLTRGGKMVAEIQLIDPNTGGVMTQFTASK